MAIFVSKADSPSLLEEAFKIRKAVFVMEQAVDPKDEFDEFEDASVHFLAFDNGSPAGTARWRKTAHGIKLERFAVIKSSRNKGIGSQLVSAVLRDIEEQCGGDNYLYMHAQLEAIPLYARFGFEKSGEPFVECGIRHHKMSKRT